MKDKIRYYFLEEQHLTERVSDVLTKFLSKYEDIANEFIRWTENHKFDVPNAVEVEGYTASKIHELAPWLDGAGVYSLMVTLRDTPEKGMEYIKQGFPRK